MFTVLIAPQHSVMLGKTRRLRCPYRGVARMKILGGSRYQMGVHDNDCRPSVLHILLGQTIFGGPNKHLGAQPPCSYMSGSMHNQCEQSVEVGQLCYWYVYCIPYVRTTTYEKV